MLTRVHVAWHIPGTAIEHRALLSRCGRVSRRAFHVIKALVVAFFDVDPIFTRHV